MDRRVGDLNISKEQFNHQSILSALSKFVSAVNYMDETVMVPSRLRDMEMSKKPRITTKYSPIRVNCLNGDNHVHSAPPSPTGVTSSSTCDITTHSSIGHKQRRHSTDQDVPTRSGSHHPDGNNLYKFYSMLKAVKQDVMCGNTGPPEKEVDYEDEDLGVYEEEEDSEYILFGCSNEESSRKIDSSFKYHLRELFNLLHDFTETAKYLSHRYENEVGQSSTSQVSFAF